MFSSSIESFLEFLRETERQYKVAVLVENETNDQTQDILHKLELQDHTYHEYAQLSKELAKIRKERRDAKDIMTEAVSIVEWINNNQSAIHSLENLLGIVRKAERGNENRIYTPRAKKEVTNKWEA